MRDSTCAPLAFTGSDPFPLILLATVAVSTRPAGSQVLSESEIRELQEIARREASARSTTVSVPSTTTTEPTTSSAPATTTAPTTTAPVLADLVPALRATSTPIDYSPPSGGGGLVLTVTNHGGAATSVPFVVELFSLIDSNFSISADPGATSIGIDGTWIPVENSSCTLVVTGDQADPNVPRTIKAT